MTCAFKTIALIGKYQSPEVAEAVLRLAPGEPMVLDKVPTGRLAVDGNRLVPLGGSELKQRLRKEKADGSVQKVPA